MKKLLSTALALSMGVTCAVGFAACGNSDDAKTAKDAIAYLKTLYEKTSLYETATDYEVVGKVAVGTNVYDVKWSVSADVNNITDYIKIGNIDEETDMVKVSVTKPDEATEYKLTATVKVKKASESYSFDRKVPAKPKNATGTKDDPYSTAKVLELAKDVEGGKYYGGDTPKLVYVKGYVVDPGREYNSTTRVNWVWIVDEYAADKDENSADALEIYSITYDDTYIKQIGDLAKGDLITVGGYIQNYVDKSGKSTIEISYLPKGTAGNDEDISVYCVAKTDARTADQKITDALSKVNSLTVREAGPYTLPSATVSDVTFSWSTEDTTYTITDGKLNVATLPAEDATVTVKVTASCGNGTPVSKNVTVTIKAAEVVSANDVIITADGLEIEHGKYSVEGEGTIDGLKFGWHGMGAYNNNSDNYYLQMRYNNATTGTSSFWNIDAFENNIAKVVFEWAASQNLPSKQNVLKVELADNANFTDAKEEIVSFGTSKTLELAVTGSYKYVRITHNNNGAVYLDSVKVVGSGKMAPGSSTTTPEVGSNLKLTTDNVTALDPETSGYKGYNGDHTINGYTVTTNQVMINGYNNNAVENFLGLQFQANNGYISVSGTFTKIVVVYESTYDYEDMNAFTVSAGETALQATFVKTEQTGVMNGNFEILLHTVEYVVSGTGAQAIKIAKTSAGAGYVQSIEFVV